MRTRNPTAVTALYVLFAAFLCAARAVADPGGEPAVSRVEAALDAGEIGRADSLRHAPGFRAAESGRGAGRHARVVVEARLSAARGDWRGAEKILRAWRDDPARGEGSGDVLFWLGWIALHQGRLAEADSLLVLASAYDDDARAQQALEYRFAALLDPSSTLQDYLRGLPESPLPHPLRIASLEKTPPGSRLHPHARWRLAMIHEQRGDTLRSRPMLDTLARDASHGPGRQAAAFLAYRRERAAPDSAREAYEALLVRGQQGVTAEFARKRLRALPKR